MTENAFSDTNDDDVDVFQDSISSRKNADCMGGMRGGMRGGGMMMGRGTMGRRMMMPMMNGGQRGGSGGSGSISIVNNNSG